MQPPHTLWTIGHSTRPWEEFVEMLKAAGIEVLVDVRRFAGSRRNPQFSRDVMPAALAEAGIEYLPMPAMGGRRKALPDSPNTAWRVEAFRAYADHLASSEYIGAREALMQVAERRRTCVMCAEAVWWRCHRRLICDDFVARGWQVIHLMAPNRSEQHVLNVEALMQGGVLRYPAPQPDLF
ncbi:DUF488 domain-containing protein [Solilutibacter tolerans]|uniref:DUF488 domain-containing protein n=1 Tax=Solilutibacter tolerans TaxID=1604334 RepID=A0A1N6XI69_9GAMM|nr:DUF488 domain-containing protein [Lysobacter tolerans]SIR01983.1 Protein of unknown function, DUF488 [Lysobacter tolerans]